MTTIDITRASEITPEVEDEIIINAVVVTDKDGNATVESAWMTLEEAIDHAKKILDDATKVGSKVKVVSCSNRTYFLDKSLGRTKDDYTLSQDRLI